MRIEKVVNSSFNPVAIVLETEKEFKILRYMIRNFDTSFIGTGFCSGRFPNRYEVTEFLNDLAYALDDYKEV